MRSEHYAPLTFRVQLQAVLEHARVQQAIIGLIIVNAVLLGLETSHAVMASAGGFLVMVDKAILALFVVEIVARLFVYRAAFWRDPWSLFDFAVVAIALVPASGPFAILRALRVLRVLRLLTMVPSMRRVVGRSLYTLFQIMTLESWSMGIARPVMAQFPYAWAFFIPFILVATFTMLNLFIAIIVNAMQTYSESEHQETREVLHEAQAHIEGDLHGEMRVLRQDVAELKRLLVSRLPTEERSR